MCLLVAQSFYVIDSFDKASFGNVILFHISSVELPCFLMTEPRYINLYALLYSGSKIVCGGSDPGWLSFSKTKDNDHNLSLAFVNTLTNSYKVTVRVQQVFVWAYRYVHYWL